MGTPHTWNYYPDHLENNAETASSKKDIANVFNNLFTNIGSKLSKDKIVPANIIIYDYLKHRYNHNLFLTPVSEEEVVGVVILCESTTSTHYEDISMTLIKQFIDFIAKPITHICNLSVTIGMFPDKTNIAKVVPLIKPRDKHACTNYYRPISL